VNRAPEAMSYQSTMDEAFGTPKLRRGYATGSFRSSTPFVASGSGIGGDHYNSLGRGGRITAPAPTPRPDTRKAPDVNFNLDVVMQTPILVVPRHERSFEVLVAHLGEITVRNQKLTGRAGFMPGGDLTLPSNSERVDRYIVRVADMNVHSINLTKKVAKKEEDGEEDSLHLLSLFRSAIHQCLRIILNSDS
jgi:hypothetical protein